MDKMNLGRSKQIVTNYSRHRNDVLKIVVTDGTTDIARSFLYRILTDNVFGENQSIFVSLYELPDKTHFLDSVMIELTSFSPNRLNGISYGYDASVQFLDADVVICIGFAREYDFTSDEYTDSFFERYVHTSRFYGETIEKYAKKDARIIVLGNTAATVMSRYIKSIPATNITTLSLINWDIAAAQIAAKVRCIPTEVKNIIIWGSNGRYNVTDCRYMSCTNGKPMTDDILVWIRNDLPKIVCSASYKPNCFGTVAYALAEHCKLLWNGTAENEWTCMGVMSDNSYNVRAGMFFSYPVTCKNKEYEIVQGLDNQEYVKQHILDLESLLYREVEAAFKICRIKLNNDK